MAKMTEEELKQSVDAAEDRLRDKLRADMERFGIPLHMREGVEAYVLRGRPPGSFLWAVFEDSLVQAYARADAENQKAMRAWAVLMYETIPQLARGIGNVNQWVRMGGQRGHWLAYLQEE